MKNHKHFKNKTFAAIIVFVFAAKTVFFADTKIALAEKRPEATLELENPPFEPLSDFLGDAAIAKVLALKNLATSGTERILGGVYAVGNSVINSADQFATVGESVAEAARRFYCTVSGWLGVGCEITNESISQVSNENDSNPNVDVQVTPPVINRREDQAVEFNIDVRKEYNSSDDDATSNDSNVVNQTVIVNGITETELERRLAIFKNSLDLSSGVTVINRNQEHDNVNTDRIYETIDEASENAVIGGELSFDGINGTFSGDVSVEGALVMGGSAGTSGYVLQSTGTSAEWVATSTLGISSGGGSGVDTLADIGSTANACGASISGTTLTLQPASASFGGVVSTTTQTFAGAKTFDVNLGVGTSTTNHLFHAYGTQGSKFTRTGIIGGVTTVLNLLTADTGSLADGEGPGLSFQVSDSDTTEVTLARVSAARYGADNSGALNFGTANAGTTATRMTILPTGKVGIGTTNPDGALEVNLGTTDAVRLSYNDSNGSAATYFDTTLSSTGVVTFNTTGSAPSFMFNDAINLSVIEVGNGNTASGCTTSAVFGYQNTLTSASSTAVGVSNTVSGVCASAIGSSNTAGGVRSSAVGRSNTTSECNTSAFGYNNTACGELASAFGYQNVASTTSSSAFGQSNIASGISASVFGRSSIASGGCSTAIGRLSCSTGGFSTAVGNLSVAGGNESSAFGFVSTASGAYSSALGYCNEATSLNSISIGRSNFSGTGPASVNIGILNNSVDGNLDVITGAICGVPTVVNSGASSVAIGIWNCSTAQSSLAFGHSNTVSGQNSTAVGSNINISREYSAVFGIGGYINNGGYSTAVGYGASSSGYRSSTFGHNIDNATNDSVKIGIASDAFFHICCACPSTAIFQFGGMSNIDQLGLDGSGVLVNCGLSDERLKNIDGSFDAGLDNLLQISPISYHWNDVSGRDQSRSYSGFSAQNILSTIPEAVTTGRDGYYSVQDRPILAASVNAIKQLNAKTLTTDALAFQNAVEIESLKELLGGEGISDQALARFAQLDLDINGVHVVVDEHDSLLQTMSDKIDAITAQVESFGATVYENLVTFVDIVAKKITVSELIINNSEHPEKTGLIIYDRKTGAPICVYFEDGEMKTQQGECEEVDTEDEESENNDESDAVVDDDSEIILDVPDESESVEHNEETDTSEIDIENPDTSEDDINVEDDVEVEVDVSAETISSDVESSDDVTEQSDDISESDNESEPDTVSEGDENTTTSSDTNSSDSEGASQTSSDSDSSSQSI